jgi:hypothetical protein
MFKTRKKLTDLPQPKVRFESEDIFVLLGGLDLGQFACRANMLAAAKKNPDIVSKWRANLVRRMQPLGLVDENGNPTPQFAEVLYPLNKKGLLLCDGKTVTYDEYRAGKDERTFEVCFYDGHATAIVLAGGFRGGFNIVPLGPDERQWEQLIRILTGFDETWSYSRYEQTLITTDDTDLRFMCAVTDNDTEYLRGFAEKHGVDPTPLLDLAKLLKERGVRNVRTSDFTVHDFSDSEFMEYAGYGTCSAIVPPPLKFSRVYPEAGFMFCLERSLKPGTDQAAWATPEGKMESVFVRYDFMMTGNILDMLLSIDDYPTGTTVRQAAVGTR